MAELYGYAGKVLYVDLTREDVSVKPLNRGYAESLIGGFGVNNRIAYDAAPRGLTPSHPRAL